MLQNFGCNLLQVIGNGNFTVGSIFNTPSTNPFFVQQKGVAFGGKTK